MTTDGIVLIVFFILFSIFMNIYRIAKWHKAKSTRSNKNLELELPVSWPSQEQPKPGDNVLIKSDVYDLRQAGDVHDEDVFFLVATKGSFGAVVSFAEYENYILSIKEAEIKISPYYYQEHLKYNKKEVDEGLAYPIKIEKVAPRTDMNASWDARLGVGDIQILESKFFQVLTESIDRYGDNKPKTIKPGDKVLITESLWSDSPNGFIIADDVYFLVTIAGSLGVISTFEEYRDFIFHSEKMLPSIDEIPPATMDYYNNFLLSIKKSINDGKKYPIKFEKIAQYEAPITDYQKRIEIGSIQLLTPDEFREISEEEYLSLSLQL